MVKTVDDLKPGETGVVKTHKVSGTLGKHLREMGLINGIPVKLERRAPLGYPVEIKIQGFSLALRKEEARAIELEWFNYFFLLLLEFISVL